MKIFEAIKRMREMTERGEEFAFSFMSYSLTRDVSHGEVFVEHAQLVKNPKDAKNSYQDYMLTYQDTDTGQAHQLWQPLLMSFQHKKLDGIE